MVCVTDGGKGMRDMEKYTEKSLAETRKKELILGAQKLGVKKKDIICLDLPDGQVELSFEI